MVHLWYHLHIHIWHLLISKWNWMVMTSARLYAQWKDTPSLEWLLAVVSKLWLLVLTCLSCGWFLFPRSSLFAVASTLRATQSSLSTAQTRVKAIQSSLLEKRAKQIQTITIREWKSDVAQPRRRAWLPFPFPCLPFLEASKLSKMFILWMS